MSIVDEALRSHTSRRALRSFQAQWDGKGKCRGVDAFGEEKAIDAFFIMRRLARSMAKEYQKMVARLDGEAEKVQYLIKVRYEFEAEVDRLEAENNELRAQLRGTGTYAKVGGG